MRNETLLATFPNASKQNGIFAYLIDVEEKYKWEFLANPEKTEFSISAKYAEVPTSATRVPDQQYLYTTGMTHTFNDLLLQSYCDEKSLNQHFDKLKKCLYNDIPNKKYDPPLLYFVWGNYRFGTCRLTDISGYNELVLSGEFSEMRLNLTLVEVPEIKLEVENKGLGDRRNPTVPATTTPVETRQTTNTRVPQTAIDRARSAARLNNNYKFRTLNFVWNASANRVDLVENGVVIAYYQNGVFRDVDTTRR